MMEKPDALKLARVPIVDRGIGWQADATATLKDQAVEIERLRAERDTALRMLADWCVDVDTKGSGWDEWDENYKDALYRPGPLRELLDKAIAEVREERKDW